MFIRKPSPAMVVACVALFISLGGTGYAAVNFARNAGKVDGRDAVGPGASLNRAAGKLVATSRRGAQRGKIPRKFLAGVPVVASFGRFLEVPDNAVGAPVVLVRRAGFGTVSVACSDQAPPVGIENPYVTVSVANESGGPLNLARRQGGGAPAVVEFASGTVQTFTVLGQNTIEVILGRPDGSTLMLDGGARQAGQDTGAAACNVFGMSTLIPR